MKFKIINAIRSYKLDAPSVGVRISGCWLREFGFEIGCLVDVEYYDTSVVFRLSQPDSETSNNIKPLLVRAFGKSEPNTPSISKLCPEFRRIGFEPRKKILVQCEYGYLKFMPLHMENVRTSAVYNSKCNGKILPKIRLAGNYLNELGFTENMLVYVDYMPNKITLKLYGNSKEAYFKARKAILSGCKGSLIAVTTTFIYQNGNYHPSINIQEDWLPSMGFEDSVPLIVESKFGLIEISTLDTEAVITKTRAV